MVWIGLHGIMFLFLFSDFYKAKYTNARARSAAAKANTNGYTKIPATNGKCIPVSNGDLSNHLVASNNNKGACMVSSFNAFCCGSRANSRHIGRNYQFELSLLDLFISLVSPQHCLLDQTLICGV